MPDRSPILFGETEIVYLPASDRCSDRENLGLGKLRERRGTEDMTRCWKHVAVLAAWLVLGVSARAQTGYPAPVGAARLDEPLRYTPEPSPALFPGPMTPAMAPTGPPAS